MDSREFFRDRVEGVESSAGAAGASMLSDEGGDTGTTFPGSVRISASGAWEVAMYEPAFVFNQLHADADMRN